MKYVNFGASGLKVSRIAFGLGFRSQSDEREMQRLIDRAFDLGVTLFDCANIYGPMDDRRYIGVSEQVLGRALGSRRDEVVITSKVASAVGGGPNDSGYSRYHVMREVERSLSRLNTDHIDIYILHVRDASTPYAEVVATMDDLVRQGKIRYWGVSNFAAWELCKMLWTADRLGAIKPSCIQNPYSLLHRELEKEVMPLCREEGVAIEAYSPLAVGLLSGRYSRGRPPPVDSFWDVRRSDEFDDAVTDQAMSVIDEVARIAVSYGKPATQVAINWVLSRPDVTVAVIGPSRMQYLEDNLGAIDWELDETERARLDTVSDFRTPQVT
ncbi:MAG: aldo/keto reductase [Chloroflexi bacterium]|nr:aldo/keto reductase [Chloroflexota bacterium]